MSIYNVYILYYSVYTVVCIMNMCIYSIMYVCITIVECICM